MSGPELCSNCGGFHYRRDTCIVRKPIPVQDAKAMRAKTVANVKPEPKQEVQILRPGPIPKRGPGRPKTITDMRSYKADKQRQYRLKKKQMKEAM